MGNAKSRSKTRLDKDINTFSNKTWQGLMDEFQTFEDSQPDKDCRAKVNALGQLLDSHNPDEKLS